MDDATDASGTHVWLVLMKAHRTLAQHASRDVEAAGMGLSDFATLELLLHKGPQPVNAIGRTIGLTSGAITSAIDRLASRGLVVRGDDPDDRRARVVRLTPAGRTLINAVFKRHKTAMDRASEALTRTERATLIALLKKLGVTAEKRLADAPQGTP